MKLIGVRLSPFVRKVAVALSVKGIEYEHETVLPGMMPPEFVEISPLMKIPVLQHGDLVIPDSSVICEYLEEKYPAPSLLPETPEDRARARFMEEYGDTRLVEVAAIPFIENFVGPRLRQLQPNPERTKQAEEELFPPILDFLESRVPEQNFLFGSFCTVDTALVSPMVNASIGGYEVDAIRWPRYAAYIDRVKAYPPVAQALEIERQAMAELLA